MREKGNDDGEEEEEEVHQALNGANRYPVDWIEVYNLEILRLTFNFCHRHQVLVQHERSNIDLTRAAIQCLKPGAWLNDDVSFTSFLNMRPERVSHVKG